MTEFFFALLFVGVVMLLYWSDIVLLALAPTEHNAIGECARRYPEVWDAAGRPTTDTFAPARILAYFRFMWGRRYCDVADQKLIRDLDRARKKDAIFFTGLFIWLVVWSIVFGFMVVGP